MKKLLSLTLALSLTAALTGCGGTQPTSPKDPEPSAPPVEEIRYEVVADPYEQTILAEDGTELMHVSFQLPKLQVLAGGELVEEGQTLAEQKALERAAAFNEAFDQWRSPVQTEQDITDVKGMYQEHPEWFGPDGIMAAYEEDFTYSVYRTGSLVSIAADYYSYLGGAHPNTVYLSWNFDLESGNFLAIPELAKDPQTFTLAVADMIEVQAQERFENDPDYSAAGMSISDVYWPDYRETLEKWGSDYAASFDAEGMTVIFSAYELAAYAAGPQEFHFTYDQLASYWSDSGRTVLGLD